MNRILQLVFAFNGDTYGDALFRQIGGPHSPRPTSTGAVNEEYADTIQCRIDPHIVGNFLSVLRIDFDYIRERRVDGDPPFYMIYVPHSNPLYISIIACSRKTWRKMSTDFDVNIMSQNSSSLYLRCNAMNMSISALMKRVLQGKFAIWDNDPVVYEWGGTMTHKHSTSFKTQILMNKAMYMIQEGWWMDDRYKGSSSWVMARWKNLLNYYDHVRGESNTNEQRKLICLEQNECAICKEEFKEEDIVVNLKCNHNFHFKHHHGTCHCMGLESWLKRWGMRIEDEEEAEFSGSLTPTPTCPMCRAYL